jgi:hypothetical protein
VGNTTCDDGSRLLEDMAYKHQLPRNDLKSPMEPAWAKLALPEVPVPPLRPRPDELDELEATLPALQLQGVEGEEEEQQAGALVVVAEHTEARARVVAAEGAEQEAAGVAALVSVAEGAETMEEEGEEEAGALVVVAEEAEAVGSPRRRQDFEVGGPLALMRYSESRGVEVELPPPPNIRAWRHDFERERRIKLVRGARLAQRLDKRIEARNKYAIGLSSLAGDLRNSSFKSNPAVIIIAQHARADRRWRTGTCALTLTDPSHGGGWRRRTARVWSLRTSGGGRDCRAGDHRVVRSVHHALVSLVVHIGHTWLRCPTSRSRSIRPLHP